ncbi:MAG TPA: hypothetical protein VFS19_02435 [Planctomycetota bacterium]|nr:hypothetical protein [Planctomycetota bacterium]
MRRLMLAALVASLALPGCIVAVEGRTHRTYNPPPPPPPPPAEVTVEWNDARTVVLREYYHCDWDTVGAFEYYETDCGIPEDDLFFLLHISRVSGRNFHEVCFTYQHRNRVLWDVVLHYRINHWDLYIDLPVGTHCPPSYSRVYGYYWRRDSRIILTNYDCHALFWLRFGHFYYGWQPRECFVRWDRCVDDRVRFVTVVHREYPSRAGYGNRSWNARPVVKVIERPERDRTLIVKKRGEVVKKVEVDIRNRGSQGQQVVRPIPVDQRQRLLDEHRRKMEEKRNEEREERRREPQKFEEYKKGERDDRKDDRDDRKDDKKDDKKDDRREPPKRNPPPPPKDDKKDDPRDDRKDDRKDDKKDDRKDDNKDDRREPPKRNPPPPPKDDKKDDRKDDNKKDDKKDDRREPPKRNPPPPPKDDKKDEKKDDNKKKDDNRKEDNKKDDKKDGGKKQQQQPKENRQQEKKAPPEKKQGEKKQESPKNDRKR